MNHEEHLLTCLSEECGEVSKEVSKALRFGLDDRHHDGDPTNKEKIVEEMFDIIGSYQRLVEDGLLPSLEFEFLPEYVWVKINAKMDKINRNLIYSKEAGKLYES
jgi:NTP pyrophosphatase (non-canonical NTP hydrolase)